MKRRIITAILIMSAVFAMGACSKTAAPTAASQETAVETEQASVAEETETEVSVGMANPFVDCDKLEDAEEIAGFEMKCPTFDDLAEKSYQAVAGSMIQIFNKGDGIKDGGILVRKAVGSDDISGDYNDYKYVDEYEIEGRKVTCRGNDEGLYCVAVWTDGQYSFAINIDGASLSENILKEYIPRIE